ncbi:MAG: hypothetical protein L3K19_05320 [Thermoplasmata archaeon]|nr:hypothetical protein [Thermoplasmata archaeon]
MAQTPGTFWSLDLQTNTSSGVWSDPAIRGFLNETPFSWFRYGEWTEECNITANVMYGSNGSSVGPCSYNLPAFKSWCLSVTTRCHVVLPLPAENDNPVEDAYIASWIVHTVGIRPQFWSIGNEPMLWKHYGIPWANWSSHDRSRPTPREYAQQLRTTIHDVLAVDPGARFMGLEAACACDRPWLTEVARVDGGRIAAIGYHSYPFGAAVNESLPQFFSPLQSHLNISSTYSDVRNTVNGACTGCSRLPIFLHEYNAGPGNRPSGWGGSYANALFLAASVTQALLANVTQLTIFNLQSNSSQFGYSMINATDSVGPTGLVFSKVLSQLVRGDVYDPRLNSSVPGVFSVLTQHAGRTTMLVVNTNLTSPFVLQTGALLRPGSNATAISWNSTLPAPVTGSSAILGNYTVPPEGLLLLNVSSHAVRGPVVHPRPDADARALAVPGSCHPQNGPSAAYWSVDSRDHIPRGRAVGRRP